MLLLFVALVTPAAPVWSDFPAAAGDYLSSFFSRHLRNGSTDPDGWSYDWTLFYWANWLAWTPITALFLGRLGRGRTVREFLTVNLILPSLFGILWMTVFGGAALFFEDQNGQMYQTLQQNGPEAAIYALFNELPGTALLSVLFLGIAFISYTTAADSNTTAIAGVCTHGISPDAPEPGLAIKVIWGAVIGLIAWVMISFAGIDGIRMSSNLGGFPALILEFAIAFGAWRLILNPSKASFQR